MSALCLKSEKVEVVLFMLLFAPFASLFRLFLMMLFAFDVIVYVMFGIIVYAVAYVVYIVVFYIVVCVPQLLSKTLQKMSG